MTEIKASLVSTLSTLAGFGRIFTHTKALTASIKRITEIGFET